MFEVFIYRLYLRRSRVNYFLLRSYLKPHKVDFVNTMEIDNQTIIYRVVDHDKPFMDIFYYEISHS